MIAEIQQPFAKDSLDLKIGYQIQKIESGVAIELYNSSGDSIYQMLHNMVLVSGMNDRIKLPFIEFIISSPVGEVLQNDKFLELAKEYLDLMGYSDACYTIIKHDDKEHKHVHVLATTMTMEEGKKINDSNSYMRSNAIMRSLEKNYGLQVVEKGKSSHNKSLGESQYRSYFFDVAIHKALRSHNAHERVIKLLNGSDSFNAVNPDMDKAYTNTEWQVILGEENYEQILAVLSKGKFLNPLFKDELLSVMDRLFPSCKDANEFKQKMIDENYYMRLVSDKGQSYYVYGIPERSLYFKDFAFPERFRFGKMSFNGQKMTGDEQKHYLYNHLFAILHESADYEDFKYRLVGSQIKLIEHVNKKGVYGLSFMQEGIDTPVQFKGTDISRRLTYKNILEYFNKQLKPTNSEIEVDKSESSEAKPTDPAINADKAESSQKTKPTDPAMNTDKAVSSQKTKLIETVTELYASNKMEWIHDINYMKPASVGMLTYLLLDNSGKKHKEENDELPKKKKKRNKGLSM